MIKSKFGKGVFIVLALIIEAAFIIGLSYLLVNVDSIALKILSILFIIAAVIFILFGAIVTHKYKKARPDYQKILDDLETDKERISEDVYSVKREIDKRLKKNYLFLLVVFLTFLLASVGIIYLNENLFFLAIITALYAYGYAVAIFASGEPEVKLNFSYHYKTINEMVQKFRKSFNIDVEIKILINGGVNVQVFKYRKVYVIDIGYFVLTILNKEDIEAILLHEFAHVINHDVDALSKTQGSLNKINAINGALSTFGLCLPGIININHKAAIFNLLTTLEKEKKADTFVIENGAAKSAASALYKLELIAKALSSVLNKEITDDFIDKYYEKMAELLLLNINRDIEKYNFFLENELPKKYQTHLTFKERIEFLGVKDYEKEIKPSEDFIDDLKIGSKYLYKTFPGIDDNIKENTKMFESIKRQNQTIYNNPNRTFAETITLVSNMIYINEYAEAKEVIDNIYQDYQDDPTINYYLAIIYLTYYNDKAGIAHMYKAFKNPKNIQYGNEMLGEFIIDNGLKDELEIFRSKQVALASTSYDDASDISFTLKGAKKIQTLDPFYTVIKQLLIKYNDLRVVISFKKKRKNKTDRYYIMAGFDYQNKNDHSSTEREMYATLESIQGLDSTLMFFDASNQDFLRTYQSFIFKKG